MSISPQPQGYHSVTPQLTVDDAGNALRFYQRAFGAQEVTRMEDGDKIAHAEIRIGDSLVVLNDEYDDQRVRSPKSCGATTTTFTLYVPDVDKTYKTAIDAGARQEKPVKDEFWGDRAGTVIDPYGHRWLLATHKEDVSQTELKKRFAKIN